MHITLCSRDCRISRKTLRYGTFGREKFGFRAMSRRIWKSESMMNQLTNWHWWVQSTSKNLLFIYSVICDQTVKYDFLGVFLANSSMFPNPFLLTVLLSHSSRSPPHPGHSALALSQYKVICLRMFFTLCSVLQNTQLSLLSMIQSLRPWSLRSTISEKEVFSRSFHKKIWPYFLARVLMVFGKQLGLALCRIQQWKASAAKHKNWRELQTHAAQLFASLSHYGLDCRAA